MYYIFKNFSGINGFHIFEIGIIILIILLIFIIKHFIPIGLWISALASDVKIGIFSLVGMRLRGVNPSLIIKPLIKGTKAGLTLSTNQLESHLLSGGRVNRVVDALIAANRANLSLSFEQAAAIDLAGRDVFEAVGISVSPKIIETPPIIAVASNGIEVKVVARVTVLANLSKLIGGAGEETIIARIGEGIVTTVGSSSSHKEVLENPDKISKSVLEKGLDSGTAFEILSIDIADIDVGRNIGAQLQIEQAEADKKIAQAKAEERRSLAIAKEQEMKAAVEEMRAKLVEAEAKIPSAISEALIKGNIGVSDFYNFERTKADIKLKENLSNLNFEVGIKGENKDN